MRIDAYLSLNGRAAEAIEFYQRALGAKAEMVMRFKDSPEPPPPDCPPTDPEGIMHAALTVGESTLMLSDGMGSGPAEFRGVTLALSAADEAEAKRLYQALAEGGQATMPLTKTFFSPAFGMLTDRFGVGWMVNVPGR